VAVVGNRWTDQPGNLPGFRVWLQPSEIQEMSIINHITLLPILEDINNAYIPFNHLISEFKDSEQDDKIESYITSLTRIVLHITRRKVSYIGHLCYIKWREVQISY
jgi:hypothetical protein